MTDPLVPPPRAVIFDMDGLMFDTEPYYKLAWEQMCSRMGFTFTEKMFLACVGHDDEESEAIVARLFGKSFDRDRFKAGWRGCWHQLVEERGLPEKPGLRALLGGLNCPVGLASSSPADRVSACLNTAGLTHHFEAVLTVDQVRHPKPHPDLYLHAAQALATPPRECLALEDSVPGAQAAVAAGMRVVIVPDIVTPPQELEMSAEAVCESLLRAHGVMLERFPHLLASP